MRIYKKDLNDLKSAIEDNNMQGVKRVYERLVKCNKRDNKKVWDYIKRRRKTNKNYCQNYKKKIFDYDLETA